MTFLREVKSFFNIYRPEHTLQKGGESVGKMKGREVKCRIGGIVFLIVGVVSILFGILFVTQQLNVIVGYNIGIGSYWYGGTLILTGVILIAISMIGIFGDHVKESSSSNVSSEASSDSSVSSQSEEASTDASSSED